MTWKIRHQGSPRSIEGLSVAQVVEGLQDGLWEPTDEVMGSLDPQWVAIENHPQFADIAADIEPPPPRNQEDETRLDMNPLIDVALVLLIFFILTTSYAALQKVLEMPGSSGTPPKVPLKSLTRQIKETMIVVKARKENDEPVFYIEDKKVDEPALIAELSKLSRSSHKVQVVIDAQEGISWGTIVAIQDAAKEAGMEKAYILNKTNDKPKP